MIQTETNRSPSLMLYCFLKNMNRNIFLICFQITMGPIKANHKTI